MGRPPVLAQALLQLMLPPHSRETVSGDLLEEYREARLPAVGRARADLWYARQVAGFFLRSYGWFFVPLALLLVLHDLFNTFRDASGASYLDHLPRLALAPLSLPVAGVALFVLAAVCGSWRTGRWAGGLIATLGLCLMTWAFMALWWGATFYPFAQVQQSNPYWINAWHWSIAREHTPSLFGLNPGTPDETFLQWIFWDNIGAWVFLGLSMGLLASACGVVGGAVVWTCGRLGTR